MRYSLLITMMLCQVLSFGQVLTPERYQNSIFSTQASIDVQYGTAPQWVWPYWNVDLDMDIYQPVGDSNSQRPLIIFAHAGGFINGDKGVDDMVAICDTFTRKGFVTASIGYRKGFDPLDAESAERAVYRAIQDGKAAVRYFKEYADIYGVDTNNIFFGGMSAGGFISLHVAYLDKESERPASTYGGGTVNDLGCLDCAGNNFPHTSKVKAILDFWGGVIDTTIVETGDIPVMMMHGTADPTVPFNTGHPFGLSTLPQTYGALPLKNQCDFVGVEYQYYINDMDIHMMDGSDNGTWNPAPNAFWGDTLLPYTKDFIYELIKPNTTKLSPDTMYFGLNGSGSFEVSSQVNSQYLWYFDTTNVLELQNNGSEVDFKFITPGVYEIKAQEYNNLLAAGDTLTFVAVVDDDAGIAQQENVNLIAYPNPTNGIVTIQSDQTIEHYFLYDLSGKLVQNNSVYQSMLELDLSNLRSGFYFLNCRSEKAQQTIQISKE
ncbi:T9SS type A sorting domain-containing protein [Paracrocinitomix mangrovi]|uniref:T9SS type A sorting domain-containing protein n=1 Tax=Paracrocinitomix mangrovi TaxID=2862509 RepID=UPI001C8D3ED1|nr:T9SS type A sorting domain-containing protein [Paracrocinitomix mangrovi]UKN03519.1 T9SS type A sorting domain-containing protein [Paracrocinitomix mangrovi]